MNSESRLTNHNCIIYKLSIFGLQEQILKRKVVPRKMALKMEKQELMEIYDRQTEAWKLAKTDQPFNKQLSTIEETLSRFGLMKNEIKVYLHLAMTGEMKAAELAEAISLHRTETYRILRDLEKKGIVFAIFEKPLKFTSLPLDKAIDLLVDAQKIEIKLLEQEKTRLVNLWSSMPKARVANEEKQLLQMLEGEQRVLMKINELLERSEKEFQVFASADYLSQLYYSDFSDKLKSQADKIHVTLVTDNTSKSTYFLKQIQGFSDSHRIIDGQSLPCFMISDNKEVVIVFNENDSGNDEKTKKKSKTAAFWTNYSPFVKILGTLFSKIKES